MFNCLCSSFNRLLWFLWMVSLKSSVSYSLWAVRTSSDCPRGHEKLFLFSIFGWVIGCPNRIPEFWWLIWEWALGLKINIFGHWYFSGNSYHFSYHHNRWSTTSGWFILTGFLEYRLTRRYRYRFLISTGWGWFFVLLSRWHRLLVLIIGHI